MEIEQRIKNIKKIIANAETAEKRSPGSVKLLAVSKGHSVASIRAAIAAQIYDFGENYLQEALPKISELANQKLSWHFIGRIQKNKIKNIAEVFSWVHTITDFKTADLLSKARVKNSSPLNVCIQVNLDQEPNKSGVSPEQVVSLATQIRDLPQLNLCGLMCIPKIETDENLQYLSFLRLKNLLAKVNQELGTNFKTLSMGMSKDMVPAIRAGSTIVRIGTAIFGERT